jgi:nucleotide-binding universal stress UspA family protein
MKILVAVDESEPSRHALQQALRLIVREDTTFLILAVESPVAIPSSSSYVPGVLGEDVTAIDMQERSELIELEEKRTQTALQWAEQLCKEANVPCITRLELGDPKHVICDIAKQENPDLLVVGSHGYGVVDRVLLGSVSDYVVHHASCPTLVVR